jgi:hypothetical protein
VEGPTHLLAARELEEAGEGDDLQDGLGPLLVHLNRTGSGGRMRHQHEPLHLMKRVIIRRSTHLLQGGERPGVAEDRVRELWRGTGSSVSRCPRLLVVSDERSALPGSRSGSGCRGRQAARDKREGMRVKNKEGYRPEEPGTYHGHTPVLKLHSAVFVQRGVILHECRQKQLGRAHLNHDARGVTAHLGQAQRVPHATGPARRWGRASR